MACFVVTGPEGPACRPCSVHCRTVYPNGISLFTLILGIYFTQSSTWSCVRRLTGRLNNLLQATNPSFAIPPPCISNFNHIGRLAEYSFLILLFIQNNFQRAGVLRCIAPPPINNQNAMRIASAQLRSTTLSFLEWTD
jgi:hypothetical protein